MQTDSDKVLAFLGTQKLAVIATGGGPERSPESALVAFTEDDQLRLYFQTGHHTRKAQNLATNPRVSLVIGLTLGDLVTVQYEGLAEQLVRAADLDYCKRRFVAKDSPTTDYYFNHPTAIFFRVTPTWIGCSDYRAAKPVVFELFF
ncbi:MAG TPA: pyridoxamine 5'-phosphate oxidase family protein [Candidatus Saccharimonas sp.]|nr:pyridoxamine 5'-phosphate oxidase family protein [Candidatus Saccharimonas sp.]